VTAAATATAEPVLTSTIATPAVQSSSLVAAKEIELLIACRAMHGSREPFFS
jgi:hypothetical protein